MNPANPPKFPDGFLWGTATAPTQIEGHIQNEWTDFTAEDGSNCRIACDHYHRYAEDVNWMAELGVNAYRMGIEWSRLQPAPYAELNQVELERYCDLLDRLKSAGIVPMVVLHHFANPPWISKQGGWVNADTVPAFVDYVKKLVPALRDRVHLWNTFNEPDTYASLAYLLGGFPPCHKWRIRSFQKVIANMAEAHVQVSRIIRRDGFAGVSPQVGIAKNWTFFMPFRKLAFWDYLPARLCHLAFNRYVLNAFLGGRRLEASTYLGLNYYGQVRFGNFKALIPASGAAPDRLAKLGLICDDMVERNPRGLATVLNQLHRECQLPIYITEHGSASVDSDFRIRDLTEHLHALKSAMNQGVDVRGLFYWSLLDTFEWHLGYTKKFGLLSVDFGDKNLPRRMNRVGEFFRKVCGSEEERMTDTSETARTAGG